VKKIKLLIVGTLAYLDGRDPDAQPPLTVGVIQLWDSPDRTRVVARLRHGTKVRILEKTWRQEDDRWYYRIRHRFRQGWVPEMFLTVKKPDVMGDIV
jgi:hypothetical protein